MAEQKFETLMEKLEALVSELEEGELGLEEALKKYEQGVKAYKKCRELLERAEKKIEVFLKDESGELTKADFEQDTEPREGEED